MSIGVIDSVAHGILTWAGRKSRNRRTNHASVSKELALLIETRTLERQARSLLVNAGEALALHDDHTPFDTKQIGSGKGILAVKMAVNHAIRARRQLRWDDDFVGANIQMNIAKAALASAVEKAALGKDMAYAKSHVQPAERLEP